jgi:hypothetical protein
MLMRKSRKANVDAMLRHLASHHDPQDFPSTAFERQALIEAAGKRRLIQWQKERRRYELTPIGLRRLKRGGGLGVPALAISAGIGATIGAVALAMLWLPGDRSAGNPTALGPPGEKISAVGPAPGSTTETSAAPAPVTAASVVPPASGEPATIADPAAPSEPVADPTIPAAKEPGKRSRHRQARTSHRNWTFGHRYRDERFAGSGRQ